MLTPPPSSRPATKQGRWRRGACLRAQFSCSSTQARAAALVLGLLVVGVLGGCTAEEAAPQPAPEPVARILRPEPGESTAAQSPGELPITEETDTLEGLIVSEWELEVGQCFNSYLTSLGSEELQRLTTLVDCSVPHDGEVYFQVLHPAPAEEPYPGPEEMLAWAQQQCYARFADFIGQEYELSQLEIGTVHPTEETWTDPWGVHREVTCYVEAWRGGRLAGSMYRSGF